MTKRINLQSSKGIIFLGDLHVDSNSLQECEDIANEIAFSNKADVIVQLGDICDKNKLSSHELDTLTSIAKNWQTIFKEVHIIEGNHDKLDKEFSIIMYLKHYGLKIHDDDIIFDTPFGVVRCGHYFLDKSNGAFGHYRYSLEEWKKDIDYGLLGHQHDFQSLGTNFCHLGSSRFVSFGEHKVDSKKFAVLNSSGLELFDINSTIPMFDISTLQELERVPKKAKVRYIFKSFEQLKNELETVNNKKNGFYHFQKKLDFDSIKISKDRPVVRKTGDLITDFLNNIEDKEVKNILAEEFKKEYK